MAAEQKEHDRLRRLMRKVKRCSAQGHEAAKAYAGIKSDEELIEWAKAALPGLRRWLLGGPKSFIQHGVIITARARLTVPVDIEK